MMKKLAVLNEFFIIIIIIIIIMRQENYIHNFTWHNEQQTIMRYSIRYN